MNLRVSDTELIKAKENPYPTIFLLNESHLKPECQDIGYSDERDFIEDVQMRISLADVAILTYQGKSITIKESRTINLLRL